MNFDDPKAFYEFSKSVKQQRDPLRHDARQFLERLKLTMLDREKIIPAGDLLWRSQRGVVRLEVDTEEYSEIHWVGHPENRMVPKLEFTQEGRCNSHYQVALYLATTEKTAISEIRPWVGDEISVAVFQARKDLKIADLAMGFGQSDPAYKWTGWDKNGDPKPRHEPSIKDINTSVWFRVDSAFSRPVSRNDEKTDYWPTQVLADHFRSEGFDGLVYKSQFGSDSGYNVVIFEPRNMKFISCAPFVVDSINVEFSQTDVFTN